jgi:hybrid cluster-associated redox disulfide protein
MKLRTKKELNVYKMTINDLLKQNPQATNVFIRRMMLCVGCPAAGFHTLEDAAKLYGYKLDDLAREINGAIRDTQEP